MDCEECCICEKPTNHKLTFTQKDGTVKTEIMCEKCTKGAIETNKEIKKLENK